MSNKNINKSKIKKNPLSRLRVIAGARKRRKKVELDDSILKPLQTRYEALLELNTKLKESGGDCKKTFQYITEMAAKTLDVERVSIWLRNKQKTKLHCSDHFYKSTSEHSSGSEILATDYPVYFQTLDENKVVDAGLAKEDKRLQEFLKSHFDPMHISSVMDVPIYVGEKVVGIVRLEHTGEPRNWTAEEQTFSCSIADAAALAVELNERITVQEKLRESEDRLRSLYEASNEGIVIHDQAHIVAASPAVTRIFGYSEAELLEMTPVELAAEESRPWVIKNMKAEVETAYEAVGLRKNGERFWGEVQGRPFVFEGKKLRLVSIRDISERKKAENELELALSLTRAALESTADGILVVDKSGKITGYNKQFVRMWKIPDDILLSRDDTRAIAYVSNQLKYPDVFYEKVKELYADPQRESYDILEFNDGQVFERYSKPQVAHGEIIGRVWSFRDVTEKVRREIEIQQLNQDLERRVKERTDEVFDLYNNSPTGYHSLDREGKIIKVNHAELRMLGYTREEMLGKDLASFLTPESAQIFKENYAAFLNEGNMSDLELQFIRRNKTIITVSVNATALLDRHKNIIVARMNLIDISEKKKLEEALRESEQKYRTMIEAAGDVVYATDARGRFTYVSQRSTTLTGYKPEELIGKVFRDIIAPAWKAEVEKFYTKQYKEKIPETIFSFQILTKSGEEKWVEQTVVQLREGERIKGYQSIVRDVTARVKAQEDLKAATVFLNTVLDNIPNMIFVKDAKNLRYLRFNTAGEKLWGYPSEELVGKSDHQIFPSDQADFHTAKDREVLNERHPVDIEEELISTREGDKWVHTKKLPIMDAKGQPLYLLGISEDITERKKAAERMAENVERTETIIRNAPNAVVVIDEQGKIINWNSKAEMIFGRTSQEVLGKVMSELIMPAPFRVEHNKGFANYLRTGEGPIFGKTLELSAIRRDGTEFPIELSVSSSRIRGQYIFTAFISDITDRKMAEKKLSNARKKEQELAEARDALIEELKRSNKEVEQFAYIASHDLQEPLRVISNYVGLFERSQAERLDEKSAGYMRFIMDAATRMKTLINDLLEYSRIGRHEAPKERLDANELLKTVLSDMAVTLKESGATINIAKLPVVEGYPIELKSLFQNLISNAIKFRKKDVKPIIEISAKENDKEWIFTVADNGIGIEKKYHERIFVIFQRLHTQKEYPGTGIGLSHCKKIVELHKGRIWVESEPGQGSTFYFTLPKTISHEKIAEHPAD